MRQASAYGSLVKGSRRRPLTAESWVRFPYELLSCQVDLAAFFLSFSRENITETNDALVYDRREAVFLASRATRSASMKP